MVNMSFKNYLKNKNNKLVFAIWELPLLIAEFKDLSCRIKLFGKKYCENRNCLVDHCVHSALHKVGA